MYIDGEPYMTFEIQEVLELSDLVESLHINFDDCILVISKKKSQNILYEEKINLGT